MAGGHGIVQVSSVTTFKRHVREISVGIPPERCPTITSDKPCGFSYILHPSGNLTNKTPCSVELGAGGGLVGLAVARGCEVGMPIHITDQIPMFELMKDNIALNNLSSAVVASILDWGEPIPSHIPSKPDIILAADCVYFEPAFPLLIATLHDLLGPNSVCYFCYKRRRRADLRFMKMAKKAFDVQEIRDDPNAAEYSRESLYLYTIRLKPTKQPTTLTPISPPAESTRSETDAEKGQ